MILPVNIVDLKEMLGVTYPGLSHFLNISLQQIYKYRRLNTDLLTTKHARKVLECLEKENKFIQAAIFQLDDETLISYPELREILPKLTDEKFDKVRIIKDRGASQHVLTFEYRYWDDELQVRNVELKTFSEN